MNPQIIIFLFFSPLSEEKKNWVIRYIARACRHYIMERRWYSFGMDMIPTQSECIFWSSSSVKGFEKLSNHILHTSPEYIHSQCNDKDLHPSALPYESPAPESLGSNHQIRTFNASLFRNTRIWESTIFILLFKIIYYDFCQPNKFFSTHTSTNNI